MKSTFAKIVDKTVGAVLIFAAATAVLRYYTTLDYAVFSAIAVTACVLIMSGFAGKRKAEKLKISEAAADMFYDFMFFDDSAPSRLLMNGLKRAGASAVLKGKTVYVGKTAAFCAFDSQLSQRSAARAIARAKHFGAEKLVLFCKAPPASLPDVEGFSLKTVSGDDTYALFASLGALPDRKFEKRKLKRFAAFEHALGKDKLPKYFLLSASMFALTALIGFSVVTFICASVSSVLFVAACAYNAANARKNRRRKKDRADANDC